MSFPMDGGVRRAVCGQRHSRPGRRLPDRRLTFRVDVERIEPVIRASGGPITVIDVPVIALDSPPNGPVEQPDEGLTVEANYRPA